MLSYLVFFKNDQIKGAQQYLMESKKLYVFWGMRMICVYTMNIYIYIYICMYVYIYIYIYIIYYTYMCVCVRL